ncbi:hypothetical protein [Gleimia hominis]|uniref:hypothetical protein n=1 Tax=Gleimia hominis TaxID=595468 RepID=UPI000C8019D3|nr:hypothetical protein [Gleimia hominis]WIK63885.1 hypothetical protein CJ187_006100 [Gleimia hominis]
MSALHVIYLLVAAAVVITMILSLVRLALGPSLMDRVLASDVISVAGIIATILVCVTTGRTDVMFLPVIMVMISFVLPVSVGRLTKRVDPRKRILTPEEARAQQEALSREAHAEQEKEQAEALREARARHEDKPGASTRHGTSGENAAGKEGSK